VEVEALDHHVVQGRRRGDLDCGYLLSGTLDADLVHDPGSVKDLESELMEGDPGIGNLFLHHLLAGQDLTLGDAGQGSFAHHVERPLADAYRTHCMVQPSAAEAGLGDGEGLACAAEKVLGRNTAVGEADVSMGAFERVVADQSDVAHEVHARGALGDEEHGSALVDRYLGIGDRHDDDERCVAEVRGEPLFAVDHPLVAVTYGGARELRGIRSGGGFGHGVRRADPSLEEGLEELASLVVGAVVRQDLGIAGVRRLGAEDARCPV
jgi:hypothetical protein